MSTVLDVEQKQKSKDTVAVSLRPVEEITKKRSWRAQFPQNTQK